MAMVGAPPGGFTTGLGSGENAVDRRALDDPTAPAGSEVLVKISADDGAAH